MVSGRRPHESSSLGRPTSSPSGPFAKHDHCNADVQSTCNVRPSARSCPRTHRAHARATKRTQIHAHGHTHVCLSPSPSLSLPVCMYACLGTAHVWLASRPADGIRQGERLNKWLEDSEMMLAARACQGAHRSGTARVCDYSHLMFDTCANIMCTCNGAQTTA